MPDTDSRVSTKDALHFIARSDRKYASVQSTPVLAS